MAIASRNTSGATLLEISRTDLIQEHAELVERNRFYEVGIETRVVSAFDIFFHSITAEGDCR